MGLLNKLMIIGIDDPPDMIESIRKGEVWVSFNQNFKNRVMKLSGTLLTITREPISKVYGCGYCSDQQNNVIIIFLQCGSLLL
jgi:hypothetical protein